jgi:hypothetical protein
MPLTPAEHAFVQRETMRRRNAAARSRRAGPVGLFLALPGVVTWRRPRQQPLRNGGTRTAYPAAYEQGRELWQTAVRARVLEADWTPPPVAEALGVVLHAVGPGRFDLDRVCTAVLDALQGGGALRDDCRVWRLYAERRRPAKDEPAHVDVLLTTVGDGGTPARSLAGVPPPAIPGG